MHVAPATEEPVKVIDVVHGETHVLPRSTPAFRVPYDLFHPTGPVVLDDGLVTYEELEGEVRTGRAVPATLAEVHAGERVLVRLPWLGANEWWLCEVDE
jgi:hypothetical protein